MDSPIHCNDWGEYFYSVNNGGGGMVSGPGYGAYAFAIAVFGNL